MCFRYLKREDEAENKPLFELLKTERLSGTKLNNSNNSARIGSVPAKNLTWFEKKNYATQNFSPLHSVVVMCAGGKGV